VLDPAVRALLEAIVEAVDRSKAVELAERTARLGERVEASWRIRAERASWVVAFVHDLLKDDQEGLATVGLEDTVSWHAAHLREHLARDEAILLAKARVS
jgi:hypothetical protein